MTQQPAFWIGQTIPAGALLLLGIGLWVQNARIANQPRRMLNREKRLLWEKIDASTNRPEVLQAAVRLLELNSLTPKSRQKTLPRPLDEVIGEETIPQDLRSDVRELLDLREATIYGHVGSDSVTEDERTRIKSILNRWKATA